MSKDGPTLEFERAMLSGSHAEFTQAAEALRAKGCDPDFADLMDAHGLRLSGDLEGARALFDRIARSGSTPPLQVRATAGLAWVLRQQGRLHDALSALQRVEDHALAGEAPERASWAHQLASCLLFAGRIDEARMAARMGMRGAPKLSRAFLLEVDGRTRRADGDLHSAEQQLREAFDIFRDAGATEPAANALTNVADVVRELGRFDEARVLLEGARACYVELDEDHGELGTVDFNLGLLALDRGDRPLARQHFDRALPRLERRRVFLGATHLGLAVVASENIEPSVCARHAQRALAELRGQGFYDRDLLAMAIRAVRGPGAKNDRELWTLILEQAMGLGDEDVAAAARAALSG